MARAIISGISDQDGAHLSRLLLDEGYEVHVTACDAQMSTFGNLQSLGLKKRISFHSIALNDFCSILQVLAKARPDEIHNLAGQSSVGLSFDQPGQPGQGGRYSRLAGDEQDVGCCATDVRS